MTLFFLLQYASNICSIINHEFDIDTDIYTENEHVTWFKRLLQIYLMRYEDTGIAELADEGEHLIASKWLWIL